MTNPSNNKPTVWVDMDGTIANCEHRRFHLDTKNWDGFFSDMHMDTVYDHTFAVVSALKYAGWNVVIVTARPDDSNYKQMTLDWLKKHKIPYDALYMRRGGDYRKDSIVKIELLQKIMDDGWDIQFALDDRQQVVDALRSYGIPVMQVNPGDFDDRQGGSDSKYAGECLLHMMVGPSGAGKSTYIEKHYKPDQVVSSDSIRVELFGSFEADEAFTPEGMARTWKYFHSVLRSRLDVGLFTVADATNIRAKDRKAIVDIVPKGQLVQYVVVDRPYDEKLKTRGWRPEWLVEKHHNTFKQNLKLIRNADGYGNVMVDLKNCKGDYKI